MKRILLLISALIGVCAVCQAQADYLPTPPSINAQSFLQNINHPVSHYTGTVNVEIPICTIELKDISIPVSLTYNTSGIKVEQEASTVGLGWSLNVGGAITKTIMGENDFYESHTYFNSDTCNGSPHIDCNSINDITGICHPIETSMTLSDYSHNDSNWRYFLNQCSFEEGYNALNNTIVYSSSGGKEFAPDLFNYSFGAYSGTFIFNREGNIVKEKEDYVKLNPVFKSDLTDITYWEAITSDGTVYTFRHIEKVEYQNNRTCNDCWYLTSIKTLGGSQVEFTYAEGPTQYKTFSRYQTSGRDGTGIAEQIKYNRYENSSYLKSIIYQGDSLTFNYIYDRIDAEWLPRLKDIKKHIGSQVTTIWEMQQSYFSSNRNDYETPTVSRLTALELDGYNGNWNTKRLRLDAVHAMSSDYTDTLEYSLSYNETYLPTKLSTAVDHWGYYNGQYNESLIGMQHHYIDGPNGKEMLGGGRADRSVYSQYNQAYSLRRITYPTGGYTEFTYETNEYDTANMEGDPYKANYYYTPITNSIYEGEGYNNVPGTAINSKTISIPSGPSSYRDIWIHYKVVADPSLYNNQYNADMSLTLSFAGWSKTLIAPELPIKGEMSKDACVFEGNARTSVPYGDHTIRITGSLRKVLDESLLEVTYYQNPQDYIAANRVSKAGGLRIKEMKTFTDPEICASRKVFGYVQGNESTGKLMSFPRYNTGDLTYSSSPLRNNGYSVGYSKVSVTDFDMNGDSYGRTEYEYINRPDSNYCYSWAVSTIASNLVDEYSIDANPTGVLPHKHNENGTLIQKTVYDSAGRLVGKTINEYSIADPQWTIIWGIAKDYKNVAIDNAVYYSISDIYYMSGYLKKSGIPMGYVYPAIQPVVTRLLQTRDISYENGNPIETKHTYSYSSDYTTIVEKESTTTSDGNTTITDYFYPFDFNDSVMQRMTALNMISSPVKTVKSRNGSVIMENVDTYALYGSTSVPRINKQSYKTSSDGEIITAQTILTYDTNGNPQWINSQGLDVVYIWGYGGQYPIAEIKNATLSVVNAALSDNSDILSSPLSTTASINDAILQVDALRTSLPNAMVTTITYIPGTGPSSITDPRGVINKYYYDGFGRLIKVTEKINASAQENIISSHSYNYANN